MAADPGVVLRGFPVSPPGFFLLLSSVCQYNSRVLKTLRCTRLFQVCHTTIRNDLDQNITWLTIKYRRYLTLTWICFVFSSFCLVSISTHALADEFSEGVLTSWPSVTYVLRLLAIIS